MISEENRDAANKNLEETYFRLGLAAPESRLWDNEGFRACLGSYEHPICNFAIQLRLDPWSARRLQTLASARHAFHVYRLPGDQPEYLEELLGRFDFFQVYSLDALIAEPESASEELEPAEANDDLARRSISEFMAMQFFGRQGAQFRQQVQEATFSADDLTFHYVAERGRVVAAAMLSRTPGMLGVYNLCVSPNRRRRGLGSSFVRWSKSLAYREGRAVTLQCDPGLVEWYARFGFRAYGRIGVFSLLKPDGLAIMETGSVLQRA